MSGDDIILSSNRHRALASHISRTAMMLTASSP
jgi:hypothetical protein